MTEGRSVVGEVAELVERIAKAMAAEAECAALQLAIDALRERKAAADATLQKLRNGGNAAGNR
jgi:hypothetical protein